MAILNFLIDRMFIFDLLLVAFLTVARFPKRKLFFVRVLVSVPACIALTYYCPKLLDLVSDFWIFKNGLFRSSLNYSIEFGLMLLVMGVCFRMSVWKVLFMGANCYFIQHSAFCLDRLVRGELAPSGWVVFSHYLFLLAVFFVVWLLFLRKVNSEALDKVQWVQVVVVLCVILFVCVFMGIYAGQRHEDGKSFRMADLACNFTGLCYQYGIFTFSLLQNEQKRIEELLRQSADQYQISKETIEMLNIKCHDLKHQIRQFRSQGMIDEESLSEMEHIIDAYDCNMKTGDSTLDIILTEKSLLCNRKNIKFTCIANGFELSFMNPCDLYALFGNAVDNAIEAVENVEDPEKKYIGLTVRLVGKFYSVHLQNYTREKVSFENGLPQTGKPDKNNHGYRVKSMQMLVKKYGGEISFIQEGDIFNLNMILPCEQEISAREQPLRKAI